MRAPVRSLAASVLVATAASAQIATDGSLGPRQSFVGNSIVIPGTIGRSINGNLFHSFQTFNVAHGQTVTFAPTPATLAQPFLFNIIGRVTGGEASTILGTIRSTAAGVNLYLVNPSGIVFGAGALVDVNGSFYASSAHYLRSVDGTRFETRGDGVSLTFTVPAGFGFEPGAAAAPIVVQGAVLRVREGANLGIVGGGLLIGGVQTATTLQALSGRAILVAVQSPGFVAVGDDSVALADFEGMADVVLQRGATINVNEGPARRGGGTVVVRGRDVVIEQATITGRSSFANGRRIDLAAARDLVIRQANVIAVTTGAADAGEIWLAGNNIVVSNGSLVDTSCDPGCTSGAGGLLRVRANEVFHIDGTQGTSGTFVVSNSFGAGRTGEIDVASGTLVMDGTAFLQGIGVRAGDASVIRITAGGILLRNGAQIDASARGGGKGGQVLVDSTGTIRVEGTRLDPLQNNLNTPSGIFSNTESAGNAGSIVVSTRTLEVLAGGEISSTARRGSTGNGGNITVSASEAIRVAGTDSNAKPSGIVTNTFAAGNAGEIGLTAPLIVIADEGKVQSQSEGAGTAGRIRIGGHDLSITGRGQVSSDARGKGDAGAIEIALSGTLFISGGNSGVFAKTYGSAKGGSILIDAGRFVLENSGGIFATTDGAGDAGRISLHARESIAMDSRSRIASETTSSGSAGNIDVVVDGRLDLRGASISTSATAAGDAGTVSLFAAGGIGLSSGATIASESSGSGLAGNLDVRTAGRLDIVDGGQITTSARSSDGGNIQVEAPLAFMDGGRIATAVGTGQGNGGNIVVRIPTFVLHGSTVSANAFGGNGGNIRISTGTLLKSANTGITASSQLGVDGTITLDSPAIDPTGELVAPAPTFLDIAAILAGRCGARLAGRASSLVIVPRWSEDALPGELHAMFGTQSCAPNSGAI